MLITALKANNILYDQIFTWELYGIDSAGALRQGVSKLIQQGDILTKIIKDNKNFFPILFLPPLIILWISAFLQTT